MSKNEIIVVTDNEGYKRVISISCIVAYSRENDVDEPKEEMFTHLQIANRKEFLCVKETLEEITSMLLR